VKAQRKDMFSTEINGLLKDDNFEVLKLLSQYNPEQFRKDVNEVSEEGNSFFVSLVNKNNQLSYVKKLLELCELFDYDFSNRQRAYKEEDIYKLMRSDYNSIYNSSYNGSNVPMNKNNPQVIPEYMIAFAYVRQDETFAFLTEKMGKEKMLQLEKDGWPILEHAYRKGFTKTISLLCEYGFDYDKTPSGVNILSITTNQKLIDLYWDIKNTKEKKDTGVMNDEQFQHFFKTISEDIGKVYSKKDFRSESIIKLLEEKKNVLSKEQKETLLVKSLSCLDLSIYKHIIKSLGYKQNGKEVKDILLPNLDKTTHHELLYFIIEDKNYLFKEVKKDAPITELKDEPLNEVYGLDVFSQRLSMLGIDPSDKVSGRRKQGMINRAFFDRCYSCFCKDETIFFEKFSNGLTLFEKMALVTSSVNSGGEIYSNNFLPFLNIKPRVSTEKEISLLNTIDEIGFNDIQNGIKKFTTEQKEQIRDFLEKTWLSRDKDGKMLIERASVSVVADNNLWILCPTVVNEEGIYTNGERMEMFQSLVEKKSKSTWDRKMFQDLSLWKENQSNDGSDRKLLKNLYRLLKDDPETKWTDLKLSEQCLKDLENTEFLFELRARQLNEELRVKLPENNDFKKPKLKI
jgi:hypothetical protein